MIIGIETADTGSKIITMFTLPFAFEPDMMKAHSI